jgi:hypothetical protein
VVNYGRCCSSVLISTSAGSFGYGSRCKVCGGKGNAIFLKKIFFLSPFLFRRANKMPNDVRNALKEITQVHGQVSDDQAEEFIKTMERHGRYSTETWS